MPTPNYSISPDILQQLLGTIGTENRAGGYYATPIYGTGSYADTDNYTPGSLQEYRVFRDLGDQRSSAWSGAGGADRYNGMTYDRYDPTGHFIGTGTWEGVGEGGGLQGLGLLAAAALGANYLPGLLGGGSGAVGGIGATVPTAAEVAASAAGLEASLAPYLAAAGGIAPASMAGAAGGASGAAGGAAGGIGATVPTASQAAASAAGLESSLAPFAANGLRNILGPAAMLLGGLSGAAGNESENSSTRRIPEWLMPYYTGQNGLLPAASNLLQSSMSPQNMAKWDTLGDVGMGLLSTPRTRYFGGA